MPFAKPDKSCLRWRIAKRSLPVCGSCCRRSATHASSCKATSQVSCPWFEQRGFKFTVKNNCYPRELRVQTACVMSPGCRGSDAFAESKQRIAHLERSLQVEDSILFLFCCFGHIGVKKCCGLQAVLNRTMNSFYYSPKER